MQAMNTVWCVQGHLMTDGSDFTDRIDTSQIQFIPIHILSVVIKRDLNGIFL